MHSLHDYATLAGHSQKAPPFGQKAPRFSKNPPGYDAKVPPLLNEYLYIP